MREGGGVSENISDINPGPEEARSGGEKAFRFCGQSGRGNNLSKRLLKHYLERSFAQRLMSW